MAIDELYHPDNTTTSCDTEMEELLNNYFSTVFTQEDLSTIPVLQLETQPPLFEPLHITPKLAYKPKKMVNLQVPTQVIKQMAEHICIPLSILFNKSLDISTLPT